MLECAACRGLLELTYDWEALRQAGPAVFTGGGLWRYAPVLPIADPAHRVTLGEGQSPLLDCPALGRRLGVRRLQVKFEGSNPTGHREGPLLPHRGGGRAPVRLPRHLGGELRQRGLVHRRLLRARRPALADLRLRADLGAQAPAHDRHRHRSRPLPGGLRRPHHLWDRLVEERLFFDCGASRNAYKHEGKKTLAYEIAEQSGWRAPDVVVAPAAVGETFIATHRGFVELERLGWIPRRPLMVAAQAARANAITRAWRGKRPVEPVKIGYTVAEGLAAGNPGRKGDWVLRILNETGGVAGEAEDEEILETQALLARTEGIWAGPTGVAALAVLRRLLAEKAIDPDATICVILSETGLKTEASAPSRQATAFDEASLRRLVYATLRP